MNPLIPPASRELVFVDLETSGLIPGHHEVLELGAVRVTGDLQHVKGHVERKCIMRYPERAESQALKINGYTPEAWRNAVALRLALIEFTQLLDDDCVWVGHNPRFDYEFIRAELGKEELHFPNVKYTIDTASIAWPLAVKGHLDKINLETLCSKYGVSNSGKHTAMSDALRCLHVYGKLLGIAPGPEVSVWR